MPKSGVRRKAKKKNLKAAKHRRVLGGNHLKMRGEELWMYNSSKGWIRKATKEESKQIGL